MSTHEKGRKWRRAVQTWLDEAGFATRFRPLGEAGDDITAHGHGLDLSVECKNHRTITLAAFVDQADDNADLHEVAVTVVHRKGRASVDDAYFVLSGREFRRLVQR